MKKILTTSALCAALLLAGCSDKDETVITENEVTLEQAGITISFPESWEIISAEQTYESMFYSYYYEIYDDVDAMKAAMEENGQTYYAQVTSDGNLCVCNISSLDMTPAEGEEETSLEDYARTVHDSAIFEYLASGFKTTEDSSFSLETYGGQAGYLSHFELLADGGAEPLMGFSEFMFQEDMELYSIQVCYFSMNEKDDALSIFENIIAI